MEIKIGRYFLFLLLSLVVLNSTSLAVKNPFLTKATQPFPTVDKIPELARQAEIIKKGEPTPLWQSRLSENDLDELLLIPGQGVLVGLTKASWFGVYSLAYGPYIMYDSETGKEKWRFDRNGTPGNNDTYFIISYAPVILIRWDNRIGTEYIALNPNNGSKVWSKTVSAVHLLTTDPIKQLLVLVEGPKSSLKGEKSDSELKLSVLNLATGKEVWRAKEDGLITDPELPRLELGNQNILLIGSKVISRSLTDGKVQWTLPGTSPIAASSTSLLTPANDLYIPTSVGKLQRINPNGKKIWESNLDGQVGVIVYNQEKIYCQLDLNRIGCISAADGKLLWTQQLIGNLASTLLVVDDKLVFTSGAASIQSQLEIRSSSSGKLIASAPLPAEPANRLPDQLKLYSNQVVVIRERGVGAFQLTDGVRLWYHSVLAPENTLADLTKKLEPGYNQYLSKIEDLIKNSKTKFPAKITLTIKEMCWNMNFQMMKSQAERIQVKSRLQNEKFLTSSESSSSDLVNGDRSEPNLNIIDIAYTPNPNEWNPNWPVQFNLLEASLKAVEETERQVAFSKGCRWYRGLRMTGKLNQYSLQGDYFVKAFTGYDQTWGVLVVNLQNGKWREIRNSPMCENYLDSEMNFKLPSISADGQRLFIRGIGLNASLWKPIKAKGFWLTWPDADSLVPAPSLLAYELKETDFIDAAKYLPSHSFGYADSLGKLVIPPRFELAYNFQNGLAKVRVDGYYGLINQTGKYVVNPQYSQISDFDENGWATLENGKICWVNRSGQIVNTYPKIDRQNLIRVKVGNKYGFTDNAGKMVIQPQFDDAKFDGFQKGFAPVKIADKWGFIDESGRFVIPAELDSVSWDITGYGKVGKNGKYGYVYQGQYLLKPEYPWVNNFSEGMAQVGTDLFNWGYIDQTGRLVIELKFIKSTPFSNGLAKVYQNGIDSYIDKSGNTVKPPYNLQEAGNPALCEGLKPYIPGNKWLDM